MTQWADVVGYEGYYQVSADGQVRRLPGHYSPNGRVLKLVQRNGYAVVNLSRGNSRASFYVHRLMADAFNVPGVGDFVRHLDDNRKNNTIENLMRGTPKDNNDDAIRNGVFVPRGYPVRPHCKYGHPFDEANTFPRPDGDGRGCRTCRSERARRYRLAKKTSA